MVILNTPSVYSVSAFDPAYEYIFQFYYTGNQIYSNRAIITDNETQEIVYDEIQDSLKTSHVLPANILAVGKSYTIQIQVFDNNGNSSNFSMATLFYCFTSPSFYFDNINNGDTISTANLELRLAYKQLENELLSEYKYNVYDGKKEEIYSSKTFYTSENLTHTIYGLKNESTYYIRAIGTTTHGICVDTGFVEIHVFHTTINPNITFVATNDKTNGCIILQTNIFTVSYDIENNNYSIQDGLVDLQDNVLTYKTGVNGDFSLVINAKKIPIGTFFNCNNDLLRLSIICISDIYYCNLQIKTKSETYNVSRELKGVIVEDDNYIVLNTALYSNDALFSFEVHRENNVYGLQVTYTEDIIFGKNLWDKEYASNTDNWKIVDNEFYKVLPVLVGKGSTVTWSYPQQPIGIQGLYVCVTLENNYSSDKKYWMYHETNENIIIPSFTITSTEDYIYMWCLKDGLENGNFMSYIGNDLKIELDSVATELN